MLWSAGCWYKEIRNNNYKTIDFSTGIAEFIYPYGSLVGYGISFEHKRHSSRMDLLLTDCKYCINLLKLMELSLSANIIQSQQ